MRRTLRVGAGFTTLCAAICLAAPLAFAHAQRRARPRATFAGSCQLTGTVMFRPPLTNTPQPTSDYAKETGTCSGTLTSGGRSAQLSGQPVRYLATDEGSAGFCGGSPDATGWGVLALPGAVIRFGLTESRVSGVAALSLTGDGGGEAEGTATISSSSNPIQIAEACLGSGLRSAPVDITLQTTPAISG